MSNLTENEINVLAALVLNETGATGRNPAEARALEEDMCASAEAVAAVRSLEQQELILIEDICHSPISLTDAGCAAFSASMEG